MTKITMLKGLPASGKTTWALEQVKASGGNKKRINKDDLRAMLDGGEYSKRREKYILEARDMLIANSVIQGYSVIVDDTNFATKHEERMREMIQVIQDNEGIKVDFEIKEFKTSIKECIERDSQRENPVGEEVIIHMAKTFLPEECAKEFYYVPDKTKPKAVIFDIDGTLADNSHRSPYDETKVYEDKYIKRVGNVLKMYNREGYIILFVSGRSEACRINTGKWIYKNIKLPIDDWFLHMRTSKEKENRISDVVVKERIFNEIKDNYCIEAVYDDRDRVVEMWRSKGLQCFQVAKGDF